jgi:hypothetical protein
MVSGGRPTPQINFNEASGMALSPRRAPQQEAAMGIEMPVVDLILAVCMVTDPSSCREEHLYFESHGSLRSCMWEAMPTMAEWAGSNPQWHIERFHCEWVSESEEKT